VASEPREPGQKESGLTTGASAPRGSGRPRRVPGEIRDVSFPVSVRGYDRRAVDAYVTRVNRAVAELEATRSPETAVRHALDQVKDEADAIVERARENAKEITENARREAEETTATAKAEAADIVVNASAEADRTKAEADEILARAKAEAEQTAEHGQKQAGEHLQRADETIASLREEAEAWLRELRADTDTVWEERREVLDDMRRLGTRLEAALQAAESRPAHPAAAQEGQLELAAESEPESSAVDAADEPPAGRPHRRLH
jgi:DivIVA domain-containing protein